MVFRAAFSKGRGLTARPSGASTHEGPDEAREVASRDVELLRRYAQGDARAAAELNQSLTPRAFGVAMRVLGDRAEAEDVAQEAMLRLWKIAPEWDDQGAQVSTWLYRVVMNLCIDIKRRKRGGNVDIDDIPEPADPAKTAVETLQDTARQDALQAALMTLPERQRQAVVLRHIEELSNPEIAEILSISVEAVESLTSRAKRALAKNLAARKAELGYRDG